MTEKLKLGRGARLAPYEVQALVTYYPIGGAAAVMPHVSPLRDEHAIHAAAHRRGLKAPKPVKAPPKPPQYKRVDSRCQPRSKPSAASILKIRQTWVSSWERDIPAAPAFVFALAMQGDRHAETTISQAQECRAQEECEQAVV